MRQHMLVRFRLVLYSACYRCWLLNCIKYGLGYSKNGRGDADPPKNTSWWPKLYVPCPLMATYNFSYFRTL